MSPSTQTYAANRGRSHLVFFSRLAFRYTFFNVARLEMTRLLAQATTFPKASQKKYGWCPRPVLPPLISEHINWPFSCAWTTIYISPTNAAVAEMPAMECFQFSLMNLKILCMAADSCPKACQNSDCIFSVSIHSIHYQQWEECKRVERCAWNRMAYHPIKRRHFPW